MNFLIFGSDRRNAPLAELLQQAGWTRAHPADLLILTPGEEAAVHLQETRSGAWVFGGKNLSQQAVEAAGRRKLVPGAEYCRKNSVATAEGALCLAIEQTEQTLWRSAVLVLGYGFLGKEVARLFAAVGAAVTVCSAHSEELAQAQAAGFACVALKALTSLPFTVVLNTIPAPVLTQEKLQGIPRGAVLLELASTPCCAAQQRALRVVAAPGLPGQYSPRSAAAFLYEEIVRQIGKERT